MERGDGDNAADDGIVAEDITQLFEHIELTGAQQLPDVHEWELATPATAELGDAPILIGEIRDDDPELDSMSVDEDPELFTETHADLNQLLPPGRRPSDRPEALAAERARWQQRVDELLEALAERDARIEELTAKLATAMAGPEAEHTLELPVSEISPAEPDTAPQATPLLRRYLIGLDLVGCVHEVTSRRISIGRTRDNELRIVDPTVSRLHAMLAIRDGEALLVDANSRNGIFVNGIQMRYAKLEDGDLVTFGTVRFRYRIGSDVAGAAAGLA